MKIRGIYKQVASLTDTCNMPFAVSLQFERWRLQWCVGMMHAFGQLARRAKFNPRKNKREARREKLFALLSPSFPLLNSHSCFICVVTLLIQRRYNSLQLLCFTAVTVKPWISTDTLVLLYGWCRQMIMSGCAAFAQVVGSTRIEAELLPQWWEQVRGIYHHIEYPGFHRRD